MNKQYAEIARVTSEILGMTGVGVAIPYWLTGGSREGAIWVVLGAILGMAGAFVVIFKRLNVPDKGNEEP
ncbi:MAG: hypothetical protein JNL01_10605 [Bdellovibrionales bacterium]|nr:hypothetical protein [Bdellovibrionales bacterium]